MTEKAKYIPWILAAILLVIVVVSVNELFKQQMVNGVLENANNTLKEQQDISADIIKAQDNSIADYQKEIEKVKKSRAKRSVIINRIDEERKKDANTIASDDAVTHVRAIANIFRTYDSN